MTDTWAPQVGKFGKTRGGRKTGIIYRVSKNNWGTTIDGEMRSFSDAGRHNYGDRNLDLISEWPEPATVTPSPVREVTTKEIVPGTYGKVVVGRGAAKDIQRIEVYFDLWADADELDAAASVFTALAAALRDGAK